MVTFGHCGGQPVVFKFFVRSWRWRNEIFCLCHFASTGYAPRVLAVVSEQLIVMTRLPGHNIGGQDLGSDQKKQASHELGHALGVIAQVPLPAVENGYSLVSGFTHLAWRPELVDYLSILAMNHFYHHIRVCRWGEWNGDPADTHRMQASSNAAEFHLGQMKEACSALRDWADLGRWFPSLD